MTNSFLQILAILVSFQLFFVSVYLFTHKKGIKRNNRLFGLIFFLFSLSLGDFAIRISGITFSFTVLHLVDDGFFFLYGPLIYFYVQGVVYHDFEFHSSHLIHFIPFLLYVLYVFYIAFGISLEEQADLTEQIVTTDLPAWFFIVGTLIFLYLLCYLWFSRKIVIRYQAVIKNNFSSIDAINLDWLHFTITTFAWIVIIAMIHNLIPMFRNVYTQYASLIALLGFTFYFVNRVLFKALNRPEIFSGINLIETEKYSASRLGDDERNKLQNDLMVLMDNGKVYLNPDLIISDLADMLKTTPKILSQVINQSFGKSFYDYVNSFRCKEVQHILESDQGLTILEAMYMAGFNSKSSFNKEFKKLTGITPSEFKRQARKRR